MNNQHTVLPPDSTGAVNYMIKLVDRLIAVMDREAMAMTKQDSVTFAATQDEKQRLIAIYAQASAEFGGRLQELRAVDASLVDRLEARQQELKDKTLDNSAVMERMQG